MNNLHINNIEFIKKAIDNDISFAMWYLPKEKDIQYTYSNTESLIELQTISDIDKYKGFVFAPFNINTDIPAYIIPFNKNKEIINNLYSDDIKYNTLSVKNKVNISKADYIKQIDNILDILNKTEIKKVVLSRSKTLSGYNIYNMPKLFNDLKETYPNAFIYQVYIPNVGYWVGATPEILLSTQNNIATTVSLAGTKEINNKEHIQWNNKEKIEQQLVTKHIEDVLKNFNIDNIKKSNLQTIKTGQLEHIKTTITFSNNNLKNKIGDFISKLHPTPAVCGLPVEKSKKIITEIENYNREYYTGYLGILNEKKIDLFVNLRCLQAFNNSITLYAGGGITEESDTEKEWKETELKIDSIKKVIESV